MARLIMKALLGAGFEVEVASTLRAFMREPALQLFEAVKLAVLPVRVWNGWT